jgi:hypothetical protein
MLTARWSLRGCAASTPNSRRAVASIRHMSAVVATSLVSTSTIGNMLWNPPGSGVRLELLRWVSQIVATSATCTGIAIAGGYQTTTPTATTAALLRARTRITATTLTGGKALCLQHRHGPDCSGHHPAAASQHRGHRHDRRGHADRRVRRRDRGGRGRLRHPLRARRCGGCVRPYVGTDLG